MAEVRYAATHEAALHLDDVLARRTRISIGTSHRGVESAAPVAQLLAGVLGWDAATVEVVDVNPERLATAKLLGCTATAASADDLDR